MQTVSSRFMLFNSGDAMRALISGLLFCVACSAGMAQTSASIPTTTYVVVPDTEPREHPLDITQMDLTVQFKPFEGKVLGKVRHAFTVLQPMVDSIVFDGINLTITTALLNGLPVRYRTTDTSVVVYCKPSLVWDQTGTVEFSYEATPRKGLYFIGWNDPSGRMIRQIWTQGQAFDHRHWIPMYDDMNDKMLTSTTITFDSTYTVISNGERRSVVSNNDGTRTWTYAMTKPHSNYLLMLAIGEYSSTTFRTKRGVVNECYWYPWKPEAVQPTYQQMNEIMDFLEAEIGVPYPWGMIYRQVPVADYIYGAMENTTATIFGDFYHSDERGQLDRKYLSVNIHELVHQWFGDLITGRSRSSLWLQESFATFYPHLYLRTAEGEDSYQWSRRQLQDRALAAGRRDRLPIVHPEAGTARYYPKGAAVIDMMRTTFGEDAMRRVLQTLLTRHAYGLVETNDLYQVFQDTLGLSPRWFFDQWLYRGGEPHYKVQHRRVTGSTPATLVTIEQIHPVDHLTAYFRMPITLDIWYTNGTHTEQTVWVDGPVTTAEIPHPNAADVDFVLFDPASKILKQVTFEKSVAELTAQLRKAPSMIDRYDALTALAERGSAALSANDRLAMLTAVYDREAFHAMRSEAVRQAALMIRSERATAAEAIELVGKGLRDGHVDVRRTALRSLESVPESLRTAAEGLLMDPSFGLIRDALQKLCSSFPEHAERYLRLTAQVASPHASVEITRATIMALQGDTVALATITDYAGPGFEFITRQNAMEALLTMGTVNTAIATALAQAYVSTNSRLSDRAQAAISQLFASEPAKAVLRSALSSMKLSSGELRRVERLLR